MSHPQLFFLHILPHDRTALIFLKKETNSIYLKFFIILSNQNGGNYLNFEIQSVLFGNTVFKEFWVLMVKSTVHPLLLKWTQWRKPVILAGTHLISPACPHMLNLLFTVQTSSLSSGPLRLPVSLSGFSFPLTRSLVVTFCHWVLTLVSHPSRCSLLLHP